MRGQGKVFRCFRSRVVRGKGLGFGLHGCTPLAQKDWLPIRNAPIVGVKRINGLAIAMAHDS